MYNYMYMYIYMAIGKTAQSTDRALVSRVRLPLVYFAQRAPCEAGRVQSAKRQFKHVVRVHTIKTHRLRTAGTSIRTG